jgi:hypothetical protein
MIYSLMAFEPLRGLRNGAIDRSSSRSGVIGSGGLHDEGVARMGRWMRRARRPSLTAETAVAPRPGTTGGEGTMTVTSDRIQAGGEGCRSWGAAIVSSNVDDSRDESYPRG